MTRWLDGFLSHHQWYRRWVGGSWRRVDVYGDMRNAYPRGHEWFRVERPRVASDSDFETYYDG